MKSILLVILVLTGMTFAARAQAFAPFSQTHKWGTTRIEDEPKRIVSLSYIGGDFFLALGIKPVALRYWYGGNEQGVWPWAEEALGTAKPILLRGEIDVEQVAMLKPDLIEALWSGITQDEYRQLSKIAPVLAPNAADGAYGTPWQDIMTTIGGATGKAAEAEEIVSVLGDRMAQIRDRHPDWQDRTAVIGWPSGPAFFAEGDVRTQLLENLGFHVPPELQQLSLGSFYVAVSPELTSPYDADVLIWMDSGGGAASIKALPLRHTMRAYREGRELVVPPLLGAAMSFSSPLSLDYALDHLEPLLEAAVDGDPATQVKTSVEAGIVR
ncbi:ABC transporter substrate-binding protein [Rhodobacterales bacterium]|nr:ABC transporter substrate-binding protein [Rhodobacterales bacterium]